VPVSEHFARALDLKVFFEIFCVLVIVETVRVFLPGSDCHVQARYALKYVGAFARTFMESANYIFKL